MVWTPMNLVAPYSVPQRFRSRFPVTIMAVHAFTDLCLLVRRLSPSKELPGTVPHPVSPVDIGSCWSARGPPQVLPAVPLARPPEGTAMSGAEPIVHSLCLGDTCNSAHATLLTSCCARKLALWPFALLAMLYIAVYVPSTCHALHYVPRRRTHLTRQPAPVGPGQVCGELPQLAV